MHKNGCTQKRCPLVGVKSCEMNDCKFYTSVHVKVDELQWFSNGVVLKWSGDVGFGEYTIFTDDNGKLKGDSEFMDRGDEKTFLEQLFASIVEQIEVTG